VVELNARDVLHRFVLKGDIQQLILLNEEDVEIAREVLIAWENGELISPPKTKLSHKNFRFVEKPARLTLLLIFLSCVGGALASFGVEFIQPFTFWDPAHRIYFALSGIDPWIDISAGQYWRIVTPIFLHFGPVHLIFNVLWFWYLGTQVELHQSRGLLILITLLIAMISNVVQAYFSAGAIFGGLSGVVYGLFSYVWLTGRLDKKSKVRLPDVLFAIITVLMLLSPLGIFDIMVNAEIADAAHISGFITGAFLAIAFYLFHRIRN
jgi:GlpG protein